MDAAFAAAWNFFDLPMQEKERVRRRPGSNAGWEYRAQVRPSTGTPDNKESYQITMSDMENGWPDESELPGFEARMRRFERQNWELGMKILSCFAIKLGFDADFFTHNHDPASPHYQSTLRLIHYMSMENATDADFEFWRAGAHSDFDCLTLLHQRPGQGGLQVCPGKDADNPAWTDVPPVRGAVTCNIGDMLMRWSDDRLRSTCTGCACPGGMNIWGHGCRCRFSVRPTATPSFRGHKRNTIPSPRRIIWMSGSTPITRPGRKGRTHA